MYASKKDEILDNLFRSMSYYQRHCDTLKSACPIIMTHNKELAVKSSYVSLNNPYAQRVDYLLIDCDHSDIDNYPDILPKPLLTVVNKDDGKHHHIFPLEVGVLTGDAALIEPRKKLKLVQDAVDWALNADQNYNRYLTKNPFHLRYEAIPGEAKPRLLSDFDRAVDAYREANADKPKRTFPRRLSEVEYEGSWNSYMFHKVRLMAMDRALTRRFEIMRLCEEVNCEIQSVSPKHVRPNHELRTVATSISGWMSNRWTPGARVKVLDLSPELSAYERELAGALYTAQKKADATRELVSDVLEMLLASGEPHRGLAMKIAGITSLSLNVVQKYVKEILES